MSAISDIVEQYADAVDRMDALLERAVVLLDDGDRVSDVLQDSYTFDTGVNLAQDLTLNNSFDAKFIPVRLNLYLQSRLVDDSDANNDELTFRPDDWTPTNDYSGALIKAANALFSIRKPRGQYSNAAISIASSFSTRYGVGGDQMPVTAWVGGLDFHKPEPLERGQAMVVHVTPVFSRKSSAAEHRQFRVTALLSGYKVVHAFK